MSVRTAACLAVLFAAAPAPADPPDPLDLAHGLRDTGMPELALEYLDDLAAKNPPKALADVLPLERARARLELARSDGDEARRDALVGQAKAELTQFLQAGPHPRRAEAAVSLARLLSVEGQGLLSRADKIADDKQRATARAKARPVFDDAAKRFGQAAAEFAKKRDDPALSPAQKRAVTRDVLQAELDRGQNLYQMARTYDPRDGAAAVQARGKALDEAEKLFIAVAAADPAQPACWVARAWASECEREKDSPVEAKRIADEVKAAARTNPAAAAGARQVRYFEIRAKLRAAKTPAHFREVEAELEQWLADPAVRGPHPAPEVYAARYNLAFARQLHAELLIDQAKSSAVPAEAQALLRSAERDYRRLTETDNSTSADAAKNRAQVLRRLIGDADRDPAKVATFEEAAMAAQVQLYRAIQDDTAPAERTRRLRQAAALYERARQLPAPKDAPREALQAQDNLVFAYLATDRPYQAAVLGEHLARTARGPALAARAGANAVQAYLAAAAKADPDDADARRADRARAARLALFLDKQFPTDPSTDTARVLLGGVYYRDGEYLKAFDLLAKVPNGSPRAVRARLLEGDAAFELLKPQAEAAGRPALPPQKRAEVYHRAVADLSAVPAPPPSADTDDARRSVILGLLLAELHLTYPPTGYARAEQAVKDTAARLAAFTEIDPEDRQELALKLESARLRAVYAQAVPLFRAGKYADVLAKIGPPLAEIGKTGPAVRKDLPEAVAAAARQLDAFRREQLLVLALQAHIREGSIDQAPELFDLLKKLGGTLESSTDALSGLIATVRPQIDALRKEGKTDELDKLVGGVAKVLDKVAAEPGVTPKVELFLGIGQKEIGNYDKAAELLQKVPAPEPDLLRKRADELDKLDEAREKEAQAKKQPAPERVRLKVAHYRAARLELARTYRSAKRFDDADKVLRDALGTKDKPGWAAGSLDFRKESAYLLEARAAATADPKAAAKLWADARQVWTELANEKLAPLRKLGAGKKDGKAAFLALLELKELPPDKSLPTKPGAKDGERVLDEAAVRKGLAESPPPAWVVKLLDAREVGEDGTERPSAYVQGLQATVARLEAQVKPAYCDLFYESTRCLTRANAQLLKDKPAELGAKLAAVAKQIHALYAANPDVPDEVRAKFTALMDEYPVLRDEYQKLDRPQAQPTPAPATQAATAPPPNPTPPGQPAKQASPVADEGGGSVALIAGGLAGLLAVGAAVFAFARRRSAAPVRRGPDKIFVEPDQVTD